MTQHSEPDVVFGGVGRKILAWDEAWQERKRHHAATRATQKQQSKQKRHGSTDDAQSATTPAPRAGFAALEDAPRVPWRMKARGVARRTGAALRGPEKKKPQPSYTPRRRALAWGADIVLTLGLVLALFVFWAVAWTDVQSGRKQDVAVDQLESQWNSGYGKHSDPDNPGAALDINTVKEGQAFAKMHAPRLGNFHRAVVGGTSQNSLNIGPGYYFGSAGPGEMGNFAIAGHRDGQGAPFHDADKFDVCDPIVIETATKWYVYRVLPVSVGSAGDYIKQASNCLPHDVTNDLYAPEYSGLKGRMVTTPDDVDVVAPVPRHHEISPDEARVPLLTLTTCHPIWSNQQRLIVHAALADTEEKSSHPAGWTPEALS